MIPSCIKLAQDQISLLKHFIDKVGKYEDYEDACCTSGVTFQIIASGLGDSIKALYRGMQIELGKDDDGEIIGDITKQDTVECKCGCKCEDCQDLKSFGYVVYLCGCTDCFPHAAFWDKDKAEKWAKENEHNPEGYIIKKCKTMEEFVQAWSDH